MKRPPYCLLLLSSLLFSFYSCEFSPSEVPLTEVEKPSEVVPSISIELTPEMDTLRLAEPVWITYAVETGERELYQITVEIDNVAVEDVRYDSSQKIRAHLPVNLMEDGAHEVKIKTYTATNSGSIADKTGNESYWYELTWPVYINKQAKDNFSLNDLEIVPEGIKISWPEYLYADFDHYQLSWSNNANERGQVEITDPRQNFYVDQTYVEGLYANYSILLDFTESGFRIDDLNYTKAIKNPSVQINDDCTVDIGWEHAENENYVEQYCIRTSVPNYGIEEEHDITNLNITAQRLDTKIGFGGDYRVQLRYIPKGFNNYHSTLNTSGGVTTFALGDSIPKFEEAFLVNDENSLLLYSDGMISKYIISTRTISRGLSITPGGNAYTGMVNGSPNGALLGYFEGHDYVVRRSSDFSVVKKMDIEAFDGFNLELNSVSISDNGLVGTINYFGKFRIFDMNSGQKIYEKQFDGNFYPRKVLFSSDGANLSIMANDYSQNSTVLTHYNFDGSQLIELGQVSGVGENNWEVLAYTPGDSHQLIVSRWRSIHDYNVEVRDSRTFELLHSVELPSLFVPVAYDFVMDRVIARYQSFPTKKFSYLFDLKTGEEKKTVQFSGREALVFDNGMVFSGNGRFIPIDDLIIE